MGLVVFMHGPCILLPRRSLLAFEFRSWTSYNGWAALYVGTDVFGLPHPLECPVISPWASFFILLLSEDLSIKYWCLLNVLRILALLSHAWKRFHEVDACEMSDDENFHHKIILLEWTDLCDKSSPHAFGAWNMYDPDNSMALGDGGMISLPDQSESSHPHGRYMGCFTELSLL